MQHVAALHNRKGSQFSAAQCRTAAAFDIANSVRRHSRRPHAGVAPDGHVVGMGSPRLFHPSATSGQKRTDPRCARAPPGRRGSRAGMARLDRDLHVEEVQLPILSRRQAFHDPAERTQRVPRAVDAGQHVPRHGRVFRFTGEVVQGRPRPAAPPVIPA